MPFPDTFSMYVHTVVIPFPDIFPCRNSVHKLPVAGILRRYVPSLPVLWQDMVRYMVTPTGSIQLNRPDSLQNYGGLEYQTEMLVKGR